MSTFADIVAAAASLSADEQQSLITILQHRLVEENRMRLRTEVDAARSEHAAGVSRPSNVADLMNEIRRRS